MDLQANSGSPRTASKEFNLDELKKKKAELIHEISRLQPGFYSEKQSNKSKAWGEVSIKSKLSSKPP